MTMTPQSETITWIPVSERLPDECGYYLATWGDVSILWFSDGEFIEEVKEGEYDHIVKPIAWAYKPKGYQPDKGEG